MIPARVSRVTAGCENRRMEKGMGKRGLKLDILEGLMLFAEL